MYNGFDNYGATPGGNGYTLGSILLPIAYELYVPIGNVTLKIDTFCFGSGFVQVKISNGTEVPEFKLDEGNWQINGFFEAIDTGLHQLSIRTKCVQFDTLININWPAGLKDSLLFLNAVNCAHNGQIGVIGLDGTPPYSYKINNGPPQMSGVFKNLIPGDYTISIIDSKGCQIDKVYTINDFDKMLNLVIDSMDLLINCGDSATYISVHAEGTYPYYYYSLDNGPTEPIGYFDSLSVGNHSIIGYDEYGCVTQKLDFTVVKSGDDIATTNDTILCEGESITVGNNTYSISGNYMDTLLTFEGCDSVIITNLIVNPKYTINNSLEICSGDSITIGKNVYKTSGFYVDLLKTIHGCDSIINTNLQVVAFKTNNQQFSICPGESIKVGNNTYNLEGVYKDTLSSISGCDSLINTTLTVIPVNNNLQQLFLCSGDEVIVGNHIYKTEGKFIDTLISYNGCDSILTTIIYLLNSSSSTHQFTICPGTAVTVNNKIYNAEGIFRDTLINSVGCDSVLNIQIYFDNAILNQIDFNLCLGDTFKVNNKTYSSIGVFTDTLTSQIGCDSILVINIVDQTTNLCDSVDCMVFLPNVFSPNADGINDYFEAFVNKVIINDMEIYDRWGELVIKITAPSPRWYGKSLSGKIMHQGVYIYIIRGTCSDGSPFYRHGDVTLMR